MSRFRSARPPEWSKWAWVFSNTFTSATLKPSLAMLASMGLALDGMAPSIRMWPFGVVTRKADSPSVPT